MEKKKDAVKKVIAAMTVGKDVSMLFTDVVNCIQTVSTSWSWVEAMDASATHNAA